MYIHFIDSNSLNHVKYVLSSSNKMWFHLGLSLGLSYPTLTNIEANHHYDIGDHMTDMLKEWLNGIIHPPSWRSLAIALDCPLVREHHIALDIKSKYQLTEPILT